MGGAMAGAAGAQPVLLQVRPKVGDTLRVHVEQKVAMLGSMRSGDSQWSTSETSTLRVFSRLAVERVEREGTTLDAWTDSVDVAGPANSASASLLRWANGIRGRHYRFRVASSGSTVMLGNGTALVGDAGVLSQVPATLPPTPVEPGATWSASMQVPLASSLAPGGSATIAATFRFDSVGSDGHAFISVRGRIRRGAQAPFATLAETSGSLEGQLVLDRRRGWIAEAYTVVTLSSLVAPAAGRPPIRVRTVITQRMRVL
jgi:hypothetical protein